LRLTTMCSAMVIAFAVGAGREGRRALRPAQPIVLEERSVALSSHLGEVANGRLRRIGYEPETISGRPRWTRAGCGRRSRHDDLDRRPVLQELATERVGAIDVRSVRRRVAPIDPELVDDGVYLWYRVMWVQGIGDGEYVEDEHISQLE